DARSRQHRLSDVPGGLLRLPRLRRRAARAQRAGAHGALSDVLRHAELGHCGGVPGPADPMLALVRDLSGGPSEGRGEPPGREGNLMRAVVFSGAGHRLQMIRFPVPEPHGTELLVRVTCCTLCRSDLHTHAGRRIEPTPTVLGHEIVGRIEAFGPE